jgi:VCBS repeat-containing protein
MEDDFFVFTHSGDGIDTTVIVGEVEGEEQVVMISISGDADKPEVGEILDSVEDN